MSISTPTLFDTTSEAGTSPIATLEASRQSRESTIANVRKASRTVMPVLEAWHEYYEGRQALEAEKRYSSTFRNANNVLPENIPFSVIPTLRRLNRLDARRFAARCHQLATKGLADSRRIVADLEGSAPYGMHSLALQGRDVYFDEVEDRHFTESVRSTFNPVYSVFHDAYIRPQIEGESIATLPRSWQDRLFGDCLTLRAFQIVPGLLAALENTSASDDESPNILQAVLTASTSAPTIESTPWTEIIRDIFGGEANVEDVSMRYLPRLRDEILRSVTDVFTGDATHGFNNWISFQCPRDTAYFQYRMDQQQQERARAETFLETILHVQEPLQRLEEAMEHCSSVQSLNRRSVSSLEDGRGESGWVDSFGRELTYRAYRGEEEPYPLQAARTEWVRAFETKVMLMLIEYVLDAEDIEFIHWDIDRLVVRPTGSSSADYREAFQSVNEAYRRSMAAALWQAGFHMPAPVTSLTVEKGSHWFSEEILNRCPSGDRLEVIGR